MDVDPLTATIYEFPMMAETSKVMGATGPTEATGATPIAEEASRPVKESSRSFLQAARRNLTEEEASSPAGVRWLTADVERLDQECAEMQTQLAELRAQYDSLKDQFNDKRVELESVKAKATITTRNELLSYLCVSAGAAGMAVCPGYFAVQGAGGLAIAGLVIAAVLFGAGLILRGWK